MPKLITFIVLILSAVFVGIDQWGKGNGTPVEDEALRRYLFDRYGQQADCLAMRSKDASHILLQLRVEFPDCSSEFPELHLGASRDTNGIHYRIVKPGRYADDYGDKVNIGPLPAASPGATMIIGGKVTVYLLQPNIDLGVVPKSLMNGRDDGIVTPGLLFAHEVGHADCMLRGVLDTNTCALEAENFVRVTKKIAGPLRLFHDSPWPVN